MAKINILPASVYNRIAAGEVIERPYSVVKELVENALDAGATEISIYVENGGKQLVRVVDNGCGIDRSDLQSAFLPHATSKIAKAEDLDSILTLGFRGEAVASIASVSTMTITSKTSGNKCYCLTSNCGRLGEITEAADGGDGTDVRVEGLFQNTPVRLKFLKSDKAEETDVTTYVSRFILSRPDVAFTYYANDKKILQSFGGGMEEAFVGVYGATTLSRCYKIDAVKHGIRLRGYIGDQNFFKPNKSYQSTFINGRYVLNATLATAVSTAYNGYAMKRQYPFYVLYLQMPTEIVDVNVHPNKTDVRFPDNNMMFGIVHSIIKDVIDGNAKALEYVVQSAQPVVNPVPAPIQEKIAEQEKMLSQSILEQAEQEKQLEKSQSKNISSVFDFSNLTYEDAQRELKECAPYFTAQKQADKTSSKTDKNQLALGDNGYPKGFTPKEELGPYTGKLRRLSTFEEKLPPIPKEKNPEKLLKKFPGLQFERLYIEFNDPEHEQQKKQAKTDNTQEKDYFEENKRYLAEMENKTQQNKIDVSFCKYAGKLFNTYLLYEVGDEVYIIDQHAAHERLIFNRLKERMQNRDVPTQAMLLPFEMQVNAFEAEFMRQHLQNIQAMGFDIKEDAENLFRVYAIPVDLQDIDLQRFFNEILAEIHNFKAIKLEEILKDKLASAACKAAVKGGNDLSPMEIDALFALMDGDMGLKCPHGRPVVVKMTKTQLEKMFKRIV